MSQSNETLKLFVGIDFGTTFSGVAWKSSAQRDDVIKVVTGWPSVGPGNFDKAKTPSTILYGSQSRKPAWGYSVPDKTSPLKWFKLLLIKDDDLETSVQTSTQVVRAQTELTALNKTAVQVIADYLREIWEHSLAEILKELGRETLACSTFVISVTLPAIWPGYAQERMREAITMAGILAERNAGATQLMFVTEPEAAALATLNGMASRPDVQVDDHFVVCDAGGGTVDIITYHVTKSDPLVVEESVCGEGELCGGMFLDQEFEQLLRRKVPRDIWTKFKDQITNRIMKVDWEQGIKAQCSTTSAEYHIQMPFDVPLENRGTESTIVFHHSDIQAIHKSTMVKIEALIKHQIQQVKEKYKKRPKYIILVGGFGKSRYLYQYLHKLFGQSIEVLQGSGDQPWTAICRGAVMHGMEQTKGSPTAPVIGSRIARMSYGTVMNVIPWDASLHLEKDKSWCPIHEEFLAEDQVQWFLEMYDEIVQDQPVCHTFWQDLNRPEKEIVTELVWSTDPELPDRCEPSVKKLCTIRWSKTPAFGSLPIWRNKKGKAFRKISYDIKMTTDGVSLVFSIYYKGQKMASQNVRLDFDGSDQPTRRPT